MFNQVQPIASMAPNFLLRHSSECNTNSYRYSSAISPRYQRAGRGAGGGPLAFYLSTFTLNFFFRLIFIFHLSLSEVDSFVLQSEGRHCELL